MDHIGTHAQTQIVAAETEAHTHIWHLVQRIGKKKTKLTAKNDDANWNGLAASEGRM